MRIPRDSRLGTRLMLTLGVTLVVGCGHASAPETSARERVARTDAAERTPVTAASEAPPRQASTETATVRDRPPPLAPRVACEARLGPDRLRRAAVNRTLDAGLGNWLRGVDIDPKLERGRFRGWILRTLPEDACYSGLDLQAGDVVTRINGRRVERPEEAKDIWDGLRTSPVLVIDLLRDGRPRTLRFDILDR